MINTAGIKLSWIDNDNGGKLIEAAGVFALTGTLI